MFDRWRRRRPAPSITAPLWKAFPARGGLLWLLYFELRILIRTHTTRRFVWLMWAFLAVVWLLLHVSAWAVMRGSALDGRGPPTLALAIGALLWFGVILTFLMCLSSSLTLLLKRNDNALILAAPIPIHRVAIARIMAVALLGGFMLLVLLTPFANVALALGRWNLLLIYPFALGIVAACGTLAVGVTVAASRWLGIRHGRWLVQALVTIGGLAIMVGANFGPIGAKHKAKALQTLDSQSPLVSGALTLPWDVIRGEVIPLIFAGLVFLVVIVGIGTRLINPLVVLLQAMSDGEGLSGKSRKLGHFRSGAMRALLVKEFRTLIRDPRLISLALIQSLSILPLLLVVGPRTTLDASLATGTVLVAGTLAGVLGWLTASAEAVPELVGTAPITGKSIIASKFLAAMLPSACIAGTMAIWLATRSPLDAILTWVLAMLAAALAIALEMTFPKRARQTDLAKRHQRSIAVTLSEALSTIAMGAVTFFIVAGLSVFALIPAVVPVLLAWVVIPKLESRIHGGEIFANE
jgi:ABC-2 type transport system permease protein